MLHPHPSAKCRVRMGHPDFCGEVTGDPPAQLPLPFLCSCGILSKFQKGLTHHMEVLMAKKRENVEEMKRAIEDNPAAAHDLGCCCFQLDTDEGSAHVCRNRTPRSECMKVNGNFGPGEVCAGWPVWP